MERIGRSFDLPLLVNVVEGGRTPVLSAEEYISIGYRLAIFPAVGFLAMGAALASAYGTLKAPGASAAVTTPLAAFIQFSKAMVFPPVWDFYHAPTALEGGLPPYPIS